MPPDDLLDNAPDPDYLPLKWVPPAAAPSPPADGLPNWDVSKVRESFERHADYLFTELDNIALTREPTATDAGQSIMLSQHEVHLLVTRTIFVAFYVLKLGLCVYKHAETENGNKHAMNNSFLHRAGSKHLVTACDALYTILSLVTNVPKATTNAWKKEKPSIYVPAEMFTWCVFCSSLHASSLIYYPVSLAILMAFILPTSETPL